MKLAIQSISSFLQLLMLIIPFAAAHGDSITMDFRRPVTEKSAAEFPDDAKYVCKRSAAAPVIDGKLDDEVWQSLRSIVIGTDAPGTIARVCYDAENLYFAFECEELPGRTTQGEPKERDGKVWEDDAIEICLRPPHAEKLGVWYHFIISAANSVYDQRMRFGAAYGAAYNPEFSHAVSREDGRWTVEVALPSSALEGTGWPGRLGVSLGRDGPGVGARFWKTRRDVARTALILEVIEDNSSDGQADGGFVGAQPVEGDSLDLYVDRSYARPGERWIEIDCRMLPSTTPLEKTRLDVKLFEVAGTTPVAEFSTSPTRNRGKLAVDLRHHDLRVAELSIELFEEGRRTAATRFRLEARPCETPFQPGDTAALTIDVPDGVSPSVAYPVTFGVPFPAGALWSEDEVRLTDESGRAIPHQKEVTALWAPDGAIKWMRFDALVTPENGCRVERTDRPDKGPVAPETPLRVTRDGDEVTIDTGAARYVCGKGRSPIREVWQGDRLVATSADSKGLYVVDQNGRLARAVAEGEQMRIEASGPVASCVRFEGWYATEDGTRLARHITRIECYAGEEAAKISHTLVLTEDTNEVWFREVGLELAVTPGADGRAIFGIDAEDHDQQLLVPLTTAQPSAHMIQDSHFHFNHGANHFLVAAGKEDAFETRREGAECGDYAALVGDEGGLTVVCRNAARQHPKEFEVHGNRLTFKLFSNRAGEELDFRTETLIEKWDLANWYEHRTSNNHYANSLRTHVLDALKGYRSNAAGWAKTHELLVAPLGEDGADRAAQHARLLRSPVLVHVDPEWIYASRAMGPNYPRNPERFPEIEKTVDAYVDWMCVMWAHRRVGTLGRIRVYRLQRRPSIQLPRKGRRVVG